MTSRLSEKDKSILEVARLEVSPDAAHYFEPIAKGFAFAVIGIAFLGTIAVFHLIFSRLVKTLKQTI